MEIKPRFEFKYIVNTKLAESFLHSLKGNMIIDPHAKDEGYHVNSIYFDTPDLYCYYSKIDGEKLRYKFRVRWYGEILKESDLEKNTLFIEIKNRNNDEIFKNRVKLSGEFLPAIAENGFPLKKLSFLVQEKELFQANIIQNIANQNNWLPMCVTSYYRRPYLWPYDRDVRVTIDNNLRAQNVKNILQVSQENGSQVLPANLCVLEIKFNWAMPLWLLEACKEVGLEMRRYSKYASCMEKLYPEYTIRSSRFQECLPIS